MSAKDSRRVYGTAALLRRVRRDTTLSRRTLVVILVLATVAASGRIAIPVTIQYALDHALLAEVDAQARSRVVTVAVLAGVAAVLVAMVSSAVMNHRLIRTVEHALYELRVLAFARILRLSPADPRADSAGSLVARVTNDVDVVTLYAQSGGITLVQNVTQMTLALAVMLAYSWPPALLVLLIGIGVPIAGHSLQQWVGRRFDAVRVGIGELYAGLLEMLVGIDTIRAYGIEDRMRERAEARVDAVRDAQCRTLWPMGFNVSIGEVASGLITTAVLLVGTAAGVGATGFSLDLSAGDVVAFLFLVTFFVRPMQFAVSSLADARNAEAGLRRVVEILDLDEGVGAGARTALPAGPAAVELRGVGYRYTPDRPALHEVDVRIAAGEHVAIVGETGSGKSTFAKLVTRQLLPRSGTVLLWGIDIAEIADSALTRRVAIVPQDAFLFDRTVGENIALGREGAGPDDVSAVLAELGLTDWVRGLPDGLDTGVGQRGESLSAGERQLVALARTAMVDPDLLVLDEATSGVDAGTDVRVQRALARLTRGRTTIVIAHRMHTAESADRVLLFHEGGVVEDGSHAELLALGGRYARLHAVWRRDSVTAAPVPTEVIRAGVFPAGFAG
ncbi:ABC transporter ATP-binding protein [Nocardia bovistercoris]|uniref:ABC transporter ATP-binding protein n=1 Tax=Nocardia bovistercoris TaxID=2785916 RepID=A0A931N5L5_9NOCA|nr:ABC transporter ATP-binding protein [Nocardia bovistercoris]MBH0779541.1 ABC transporter ATP-binding protein [Nocardia bovistercoris]